MANVYYQQRHFEEESKKWKIYEKVASQKESETEKDGDDVIMVDAEVIPQARPFRERYSAILNMTVTDTDSQSNENSNIEYREEASNSNSNSSESDNEDDKKKRKLRDTSLSPTSKDKTTITTTTKENNIRKKKVTSKKKKKIAIENDPRAPAGSPILLVTENSNTDQRNKENKEKENKSTRQDTPVDPSLKGPRLFARVFKPPVPAQRSQQQQDIVIESNINNLPKTPPGLVEPPVLSPRQSTPKTPIPLPQRFAYSPKIVTTNDDYEINDAQVDASDSSIRIENEQNNHMEQDQHMEINKDTHSPSVVSKDMDFNLFNLFNFPIIPIE
ncbi:unnamed protein product, partial [Rotaria sp. Silwood1]